jgi:hypothetical protein
MNSIHKNIDNQNAFIKQSGISEQSLTAVRSPSEKKVNMSHETCMI